MKTIADQLRIAVAKVGIMPTAKGSGVSYPQLHRFVRGRRDLTLETAADVARFLMLELKPKRKAR